MSACLKGPSAGARIARRGDHPLVAAVAHAVVFAGFIGSTLPVVD